MNNSSKSTTLLLCYLRRCLKSLSLTNADKAAVRTNSYQILKQSPPALTHISVFSCNWTRSSTSSVLASVRTFFTDHYTGLLSVVPVMWIFFKCLFTLPTFKFFNGNSLTDRLAPYPLFWYKNSSTRYSSVNTMINNIICDIKFFAR